MDFLTFVLINGPFVIFNILANVFYIFCMVCPLHGERIKQPLKLLLGSLICCTITYLMISTVWFSTAINLNSTELYVVFSGSLSTSMSSSVWLNFFYYTQIVPARRALFIWIKRNIKPIIYCIWFAEIIYCSCHVSVNLVRDHIISSFDHFSDNSTMDHYTLSELCMSLRAFSMSIWKAHFFISLCVMVMSSGSTVVYLCRHMRRMVANGQSCPRFRGQVRVTVTGILQGVLYMSYSVWKVCSVFSVKTYMMTSYTHFTVVNLYMSGTTFNLGAGQGIFRQRVEDIWLRATQCCKAPKVQQSEQGG